MFSGTREVLLWRIRSGVFGWEGGRDGSEYQEAIGISDAEGGAGMDAAGGSE